MQNEKVTNQANVEILNASLAVSRAEYVVRIKALFLARLEKDVAKLEAAGWDVEALAPYPSGNLDRTSYRQAEAKYYHFRKITVRDEAKTGVSRMAKEPNFRKIKPGVREDLEKEATKAANEDFDAYVLKLAKKIGVPISGASLTGNLWSGSRLTVQAGTGTQVWNTQCIINQSVYGKLFNQWPTRLAK